MVRNSQSNIRMPLISKMQAYLTQDLNVIKKRDKDG